MIAIREGGLDHPAVRALLLLHMAEARASTPRENAHALGADAVATSGARFFTAWAGDRLLGMAALREVQPGHSELKSMRTAPDALRQGVARALLVHLMVQAQAAGWRRLSLETGTAPMFRPANRLYETAGFRDGPVFGGYPESAHNRFMTLRLS